MINKKLIISLALISGTSTLHLQGMEGIHLAFPIDLVTYSVKYAAQATNEHAIKPLLWATAGAMVLALSNTTARIILTPPATFLASGWNRISGNYAKQLAEEKEQQKKINQQLRWQNQIKRNTAKNQNAKLTNLTLTINLEYPEQFQQWAMQKTVQAIYDLKQEGASKDDIIMFLESQGLSRLEASNFLNAITKKNADFSPALDDSQGLEASDNAS